MEPPSSAAEHEEIEAPASVQVLVPDEAMEPTVIRRNMGWTRLVRSKSGRLSVILFLTASYFLVEIVVGNITKSLVLVADAFHMLSDVISLIIGLVAVRLVKAKAAERMTFGWARAEVVGALINSVFLVALCFTLVLDSIERFFKVEAIEQINLLIIVGSVGLGINLIGLLILRDGHGHSHGGGGHGHSHGSKKRTKAHGHNHGHSHTAGGDNQHDHHHEHDHHDDDEHDEQDNHSHGGHNHDDHDEARRTNNSAPKKATSLNMQAVYLHVLGDALGSVAVICGALFIKYSSWSGRYYIDPALTLLIVGLLLYSTLPVLKQSAMILLQSAPTDLDVATLNQRILSIPGVKACHELHIWRLADERFVGSVHIICRDVGSYQSIASELKRSFHDLGIHSLTIQPEYETEADDADVTENTCLLACPPEENCVRNACCSPVRRRVSSTSRV